MSGSLPDILGHFARVDASPRPPACVQYLADVAALPSITRHKQRTYEMLGLREGASVLDVGCGLGDDACAMGVRVGRQGRVLGVDASEVMVSQARARQGAADTNVRFLVADAHRLRLSDALFDAVRADRLLQHVDDPVAALREMRRVVRPGGKVVACDPDWDTLLIDAGDPALERTVRAAHADSVRHGTIGRRLPRLFADAGLTVVARVAEVLSFTEYEAGETVLGAVGAAVRAGDAGVLAAESTLTYIDTVRALQERGVYLCAVMVIAICGVRDE